MYCVMSRSHPMQLTVLFRVPLEGRYQTPLIGSVGPIDHKMFEFDETEWMDVVVVEINVKGIALAPPNHSARQDEQLSHQPLSDTLSAWHIYQDSA